MSHFSIRAFCAAALLTAIASLSVWAAALPGTPDGGGTFPKPKPACVG